jgi:uncharacterized protein YjbI with pentapeptide repeats
LAGANLQGANLAGANLQGANFLNTYLRAVCLRDANLTEIRGLLTNQLAGTDVTGAKLPAHIFNFDELDVVSEGSKNAQNLFLVMLLGCSYAAITIFNTSDASLVTNSNVSKLPIIGTEIPIVGFFWVAPIVLLSTFFYFHLYLQRLWEGIIDLPAVFPDGTRLDKRIYPWILTGIVRPYSELLRKDQPPLARLQSILSILLAWGTVPITIALFWLWYLAKQDWVITGLHIFLLTGSLWSAILLHRLAVTTFKAKKRTKRFGWKRILKVWTNEHAIVSLGVGLTAAVFIFLSYGPMEGNCDSHAFTRFQALGYYSPFANLRKANISSKSVTPVTNGEIETNVELRGISLRCADASGIILAKATLSQAKLQRANLAEAVLEGSNLRKSQLQKAYLGGAILVKADLINADFTGATLDRANLTGAILLGTNFTDAVLNGADLRGADLQAANLSGAFLEGVTLDKAPAKQLCKAESLYNAHLDDEVKKVVSQVCPNLFIHLN